MIKISEEKFKGKYLDKNGNAVYFEGDRLDGNPIKGEGKIEKKGKKKEEKIEEEIGEVK